MAQTTLSRQFIKDSLGRPIAVILPIEEYTLVKPILEDHDQENERRLHEIALAASDPLFLADLKETMVAFEAIDAEWWERP